MTSDRWRRIEALYHAALAHTPGERGAYLAEACADDERLRLDVESLLAQPATTAGFLDTPVVAVAADLAESMSGARPSLVGQRLGSYQVLDRLGAGGMGEVYRARDTTLGREVAIKLLPPAFTADRDRLARFEREARILATLNHPHIGAIYGLETHDGVPALVLELVPGETLADRIARGPLPVATALAYARDMAEALDVAHEKGIVHRDLKPANIKVTPEGVVKVLDFGLAKLDPHPNGNDTQSPTVTIGGTREGVILGTAAYMSPEQARAQVVDKRADIWAFGCVLYEMLTGQSAFSRGTVSDTLAAILEREPDCTVLPTPLPAPARRLIQRCLAKDSRQRLRDIGDARLELLAVLDELSAGGDRVVDMKDRPRQFPKTLVTAAVIMAAVAIWARWPQRAPVNTDLTRGKLERLTYDAGVARMPQFSPDGRLLAFASDRAGQNNLDIWVQQINGGVPLRLTDDPADDTAPRFSPDGNQIVFRSDRGGGGVYIVPALGGVARLIARDGRGPRFSPDGMRISYWTGDFRGGVSFASGAGGRSAAFVAPLAGGAPVRLLSEFVVAREPVWSPAGRSVLILGRRDTTSPIADAFDWWWVPLQGGAPVKTGVLDLPGLRLVEPAPGNWTGSGVLFSDGINLWSIPISESSGRIVGEPRRLTFGTGQYADPTIAQDGTMAFAALTLNRVIERVALGENRPTNVERLYSDGQPDTWRASTTRDGSMIAFERGVQTHPEIWLKNLQTGKQVMLLSVEAPSRLNATISDDGARVAYTVPDDSRPIGRGFVVETSGGLPKNVCTGCELHGFLSDNRRVLAVVADRRTIRLYDTVNGSYKVLLATAEGELD